VLRMDPNGIREAKLGKPEGVPFCHKMRSGVTYVRGPAPPHALCGPSIYPTRATRFTGGRPLEHTLEHQAAVPDLLVSGRYESQHRGGCE